MTFTPTDDDEMEEEEVADAEPDEDFAEVPDDEDDEEEEIIPEPKKSKGKSQKRTPSTLRIKMPSIALRKSGRDRKPIKVLITNSYKYYTNSKVYYDGNWYFPSGLISQMASHKCGLLKQEALCYSWFKLFVSAWQNKTDLIKNRKTNKTY